MDVACYESKRQAHLVAIQKKAESAGKPIVRIATEYMHDAEAKKHKGALPNHAYEEVTKKNSCPSAEDGLVVHGTEIGKVIRICRDPACKIHHPYATPRKPETFAVKWAARRKSLQERIKLATRRELIAAIARSSEVAIAGDVLELVAERLAERIQSGDQLAALGIKPEKRKPGAYVRWSEIVLKHFRKLPDERKPAFAVAIALSEGAKEFARTDVIKAIPRAADAALVPVQSIEERVSTEMRESFDRSYARAKAAEKKRLESEKAATAGKKEKK